jgi:hypothetical protein
VALFLVKLLDHGHPAFSWPRATPLILGLFPGITWKSNNKSYTLPSEYLCKCLVHTYFTNVADDHIIQRGKPRDGDPCSVSLGRESASHF